MPDQGLTMSLSPIDPTASVPRATMGKTLIWLVVGNLCIGIFLFFIHTPRQPVARQTPRLPAQVVALENSIAQGRHGAPFALDLSDQELSDTLTAYLAEDQDLPFARAMVAVTRGRIAVDAVTRGFALAVPVHVDGTLSARDGQLLAHVDDVRLGNAALPGFARDQILAQVNASLDFPATTCRSRCRAWCCATVGWWSAAPSGRKLRFPWPAASTSAGPALDRARLAPCA